VTLDSPERGLLLLRVRDEIRMTLDAYRTLYGSSVTFGVRKQMQAELGMPEVEAEIGVRSGRGGCCTNDHGAASPRLWPSCGGAAGCRCGLAVSGWGWVGPQVQHSRRSPASLALSTRRN